MAIPLVSSMANLKIIVVEWFRREPRFAGGAVVFAALALPTLVAMGLDDRLYQGINIWIKPMKFTLSVAVYLATLAWFAGWMRWEATQSGWYRWFSRIVVFAALLEILWVYGAAANGIGSHYNVSSPFMAAAYSAAGIVVMVMMLAAPVYAWQIGRNQRLKLDAGLRRSIIWGLWLTFGLTIVIASFLASQPNHFVGGNLSDAEGGALFGWARDGGDLRAAHFFSLHAMHFIPAAGLFAAYVLTPERRPMAVTVSAVLYSAFTIYVFVEAIMGKPFLGGLL